MPDTFTVPATPPEQADALLTKWTPLRRMVEDEGLYFILSELVEIVGELEDDSEGTENQRWAKVGKGLQIAKQYADEHYQETSDWDTCPDCGSPTIEPDGKEFTNLHCTKCDWQVPIRVVESSAVG